MSEYTGVYVTRSSEDELKHWKYKSKKRVNGKWQYIYEDLRPKLSTGSGPSLGVNNTRLPGSINNRAKGMVGRSGGTSLAKGISLNARKGASGIAKGINKSRITRGMQYYSKLYKKAASAITTKVYVNRGKAYVSKIKKPSERRAYSIIKTIA